MYRRYVEKWLGKPPSGSAVRGKSTLASGLQE